ncbi:hypothetical protein HDE_09256 [Halotydeus destructor]|nr:hypothetical protein HDE_09256 [Halotydeus destructor]
MMMMVDDNNNHYKQSPSCLHRKANNLTVTIRRDSRLQQSSQSLASSSMSSTDLLDIVRNELIQLQKDTSDYIRSSFQDGVVPFVGAKVLEKPIYNQIDKRISEINSQTVDLNSFTVFLPQFDPKMAFKSMIRCKGCSLPLPCKIKRNVGGYTSRPVVNYSPQYFEHCYMCTHYRDAGLMNYCLICKMAFAHYADFHSHQFNEHSDNLILVAKSAALNAHVIV